uniref:RGS domain-containing protein n=1 Tax=Macrostomum lignano TaxID=282301 RepID=A0A1I8FH91_9PLAT
RRAAFTSFATDDKHQLQELWETCCEHLEFFRRLATPPARKAAETAAYRRPRRREFEHSDQWLHDPRQQEASQPPTATCSSSSSGELRNRPAIDTRSMRDIRAPWPVPHRCNGDDPYAPVHVRLGGRDQN